MISIVVRFCLDGHFFHGAFLIQGDLVEGIKLEMIWEQGRVYRFLTAVLVMSFMFVRICSFMCS